MLNDDYLCLVESGKQQIKVRRKFNGKAWQQRQLLSESGFVLGIAPPPLYRDRRIKMKKSIKQKNNHQCMNYCKTKLVENWRKREIYYNIIYTITTAVQIDSLKRNLHPTLLPTRTKSRLGEQSRLLQYFFLFNSARRIPLTVFK